MLNTLTNHGFLPHSGKGITLDDTKHALGTALNFDDEFSQFLFNFAVQTNPVPNATEFSLENLGRHNVLEHDASLTRADYYWHHDSVSFNRTVYEETRSYWTTPSITIQQAADARLARYITSNTTNPEYSLSQLGDAFSAGESAAYVVVLGDKLAGTVPRKFVEYLFENERLPIKLGWKRAEEPFTDEDLNRGMELIVNATGASPQEAKKMRARRGFHSGRIQY
ncbi:hypothetical protein N0V90_002173 [Kalmusia sp. IMI 367209]|nr:hypothetical protein N0V90_002173 [Kalmusia sp. IMI 367209]